MDKIKVSFFLPNLEIGGAERVTINLLNSLDKKQYKLSLILAEKKGDFVKDVPGDIFVFSLNTYSFFKIFFKLIKYLRREKIDIFVSALQPFNMICIMAKFFAGSKAKIIIVEHNVFSLSAINARTFFRKTIARFLFPILMRIFYKKADAIICVSNGVADDVAKIIGIRNKIKVIYNPIINSEIYDLSEETVDHSWILDKNIPVILAVGRLVKAKDYPTLLNAFSVLIRKMDARLLILGVGEKKEQLKLLSDKFSITGKVDFLGFQKNPYKFMAKADVFVLSSIHEGFPTVIVEAMACGVPVVSTDCKSGPNEIIENGKNGMLVPVGDEKALAGAISKLLDDKELREKFSIEGKIRAEYFTIDKKTKEYENLFKEVLKKT